MFLPACPAGPFFQQLSEGTLMAGHIQDRWMRVKRDPDTDKPVRDEEGKVIKERHPDLWGKGDRYKVRYPKPGGGEDSKTFPDKQLKKAQAFLTKMQHDILAGTYVDPHAGKIELRTYTENYLKGRSQDLSSQETIRSVVAASIYPFLGDKTLDAINVDTLRDFLAWMNEKGISANYQTQVWNTLSSILDAAKEEKKISVNHCDSKAISKPRRIETKIVPWTEAKLNKVALALGPRYKITVPIGAGLGLRQGEIFAFTVDDIDREKMIYHCRRQIATLNKEQTFRLPKGHKTREIPLSQGVLDEIDAYAENFPPVTVTLPWSERDGKKTETVRLLIVDGDGNALRRSSFNDNVWHPAFKRAGLTREPWRDGMHALRHLFASHLLALGVSIRELAEYLGHATAGFTLSKYAHLMPSSHERARLAVNSMFKPRRRHPSTKDTTASGETASDSPDSRPPTPDGL